MCINQSATPEVIQLLRDLRKKVVIGFVGGSDLVKITEQLSVHGCDRKSTLACTRRLS